MGSKGGGGYDAGPSLELGRETNALNKELYEDQIARSQPFYEGGVSAFEMLLDQLGVNGGSNKSRDSIYNGLKDQYTTQNETITTVPGAQPYTPQPGRARVDGMQAQPQTTTTTNSVIDYDGLNAATDAQFNAQGTPEGYGSLMESFDMDKFQADPGYQFRLDEGNKAIERAAAARGQYYDPSTVKELSQFNAGMADQTYGDAYNRFNNDQNNIFNRLAAVAGTGQTANNSLNQAGQVYGDSVGTTNASMANAQIEANSANASRPSMFSTILGTGMQLGGLGTNSILGKTLGF